MFGAVDMCIAHKKPAYSPTNLFFCRALIGLAVNFFQFITKPKRVNFINRVYPAVTPDKPG